MLRLPVWVKIITILAFIPVRTYYDSDSKYVMLSVTIWVCFYLIIKVFISYYFTYVFSWYFLSFLNTFCSWEMSYNLQKDMIKGIEMTHYSLHIYKKSYARFWGDDNHNSFFEKGELNVIQCQCCFTEFQSSPRRIGKDVIQTTVENIPKLTTREIQSIIYFDHFSKTLVNRSYLFRQINN